jgi:hypothetical protein
MNFGIFQKAKNFLTSWTTVNFSRMIVPRELISDRHVSIPKNLKIKMRKTFTYCFVWVWNLISNYKGRDKL